MRLRDWLRVRQRGDRRYTAARLARELDIQRPYLYDLFSGKHRPGADLLQRVQTLTDGQVTEADFGAEQTAA